MCLRQKMHFIRQNNFLRQILDHKINRMRNLITERTRQKQKSDLYFSPYRARVSGQKYRIISYFLTYISTQ